jgi:hypothetical protein
MPMKKASWLGLALLTVGVLVALATQQLYPDICSAVLPRGPPRTFIFEGISGYDLHYSFYGGRAGCTQVNGVFILVGLAVAILGAITLATEKIRQQIVS